MKSAVTSHPRRVGLLCSLAACCGAMLDSASAAPAAPAFAELATIRVGAAWPDGYSDIGAFNAKTGKLYTFTIAGDFKPRSYSVIDIATNQVVGKPVAIPGTGGTGPTGFNQKTNMLYVGNNEGNTLIVADGTTLQPIGKPIKVSSPSGITIDERTNTLYISNYADNTVTVIDGDTRKIVGSPIPAGIQPGSGVINPHNDSVYIPAYDGTVTVIALKDNTVVKTIPVGIDSAGIAINRKTNRLYVANEQSNSLSVIDGNSNTVIASVPIGKVPFGVAVDEKRNLIYAANQPEATVSVIDGRTNKAIATVPVGCGGARPAGCELFVSCKILGADPLDIFVEARSGKAYVGLGGIGKVSVLGTLVQ